MKFVSILCDEQHFIVVCFSVKFVDIVENMSFIKIPCCIFEQNTELRGTMSCLQYAVRRTLIKLTKFNLPFGGIFVARDNDSPRRREIFVETTTKTASRWNGTFNSISLSFSFGIPFPKFENKMIPFFLLMEERQWSASAINHRQQPKTMWRQYTVMWNDMNIKINIDE